MGSLHLDVFTQPRPTQPRPFADSTENQHWRCSNDSNHATLRVANGLTQEVERDGSGIGRSLGSRRFDKGDGQQDHGKH